jgi:hypothetical protein
MTDKTNETPAADTPPPVIIDLGKKRRKQVKALRRGKPGKLMDRVNEVIARLRAEGAIAGSAQTVVVVVTERPRGLLDLG